MKRPGTVFIDGGETAHEVSGLSPGFSRAELQNSNCRWLFRIFLEIKHIKNNIWHYLTIFLSMIPNFSGFSCMKFRWFWSPQTWRGLRRSCSRCKFISLKILLFPPGGCIQWSFSPLPLSATITITSSNIYLTRWHLMDFPYTSHDSQDEVPWCGPGFSKHPVLVLSDLSTSVLGSVSV